MHVNVIMCHTWVQEQVGVYKLVRNKILGFLKKESIHKIGKIYDELDEGWLSRMRYEYVTLTQYQLEKL